MGTCGIYAIISPKNAVYVGQSKNIEKRFKNYYSLHCKRQIKIYNSLKKYGYKNHKFKIIRVCKPHELDFYEMNLGLRLNVLSKYNLNLALPGYGCVKGKVSEELKGRYVSEETREKIRNSAKGRKISREHIEALRKFHSGKVRTEESKKKQSESRMGKYKGVKKPYMVGELNTNFGRVGDKHPMSKKVICTLTGNVWCNAKTCAAENGIPQSTLTKKLNGLAKNNTQFRYIHKMGYSWLTKESRDFLSRGYLQDGQTAEERVRQICDTAEKILNIEGFSNRLEKYVSNGWVSFSTPVWANFGHRNLPISCFGSSSADTVEGIIQANAEIAMMTKQGGGTSLYLGNLRHRGAPISTGGKSDGSVHFAKNTDMIVDVFKQSNVRRGACAVYLPIEHEDIEEFLEIGSEGNAIQNLQYGITISDMWLEEMIDGDKAKRKIWSKVIESRVNKGFPYLLFIDNANNSAPKVYKDLGKSIVASNLCSEIMLSSDEYESFVCCLSSVNLLYYNDWKDTDLVETMVYFLDSVMTEFIEKASKITYMERAVRFAENQRALGLGVLGWHSYLQKNMIPLESIQARAINKVIFKDLGDKSKAASEKMCNQFGASDFMESAGRRHSTLNAIAPTKSSSFILGQVSMGIEPIKSNYFIKDLAKSKTVYKNQYLVELLDSKGMNTEDVWESILKKDGSVQHLDFLSEDEKDVFKTFMELSQLELVIQNADRQKFIDQGISFNLSVHPSTAVKDINKVLIEGWKLGMKSFYYQFSENSAQAFNRDIVSCVNCEG